MGDVYKRQALIVPCAAAAFRRLHDTGRSGLWILSVLLPFGLGHLGAALVGVDTYRQGTNIRSKRCIRDSSSTVAAFLPDCR